MDRLENQIENRVNIYKKIVKEKLEEYADYIPSEENMRLERIFDDVNGHYELLYIGWDERKRMHGCMLHVDVRDNKIWIEFDGTEHGIAGDFLEAGISKEEIVLAFQPPYKRPYTGFAVG